MIKIQAHRGASKERPENTMSAFKRAVELEADGIEIDVHLLLDGSIVVHHDINLGRCENVSGSIYDYSKKNIQSFSVGEKFSPKYEQEVIPHLYELLEFLKENDLFLNIEIKSHNIFITDVADKVVKLLDEYNMVDRCIISSFNHYILKDIKDKHPQYKVGALYHGSYDYDVINYCLKNKFDAIHPHFNDVNQQLVNQCHENGIQVNTWTVDSPEDLKKMKEYGVDTVISNDVVTAKEVLKVTNV